MQPNPDCELQRPCKLCNRTIRYMRVKRKIKGSDPARYEDGGTMPVDPALQWGDGRRTLVVIHPVEMRGRVVVKAGPEIQGLESHFGTCPVYLKRQRQKQKA